MGLLKFIAVGAAIGYGIKYVTKKGPNGRSILDDITEDAPEWFEKAKNYATEKVEQVAQQAKPDAGYHGGQ
ncbi:YtxH domain-containing protein [Mucilaginibacter sp. RB4R14]|uniref:YtxH domain-containing protein n=1 Tax=Mucilaginibacter aurantiaciroseus TaxID=2949308 RepID=UPI002090E61B|nr:YtxH domain-containing protein [Mucilaginibacter aurantiaciroseus]MCO5934013.1 YtxH domain-containing protein [Mucilaginibacter aurantiaciroseus]